MSGGLAFVYDVKGNFLSNCNQEMVDLDPLTKEDIWHLQDMILRHYNYTGSTVAKFVLDDFVNQLKNFIKVFPRDFKRVLTETKTELVKVTKR